MKKQKICIRAFIKGNLGDDLFVYTLCNKFKDQSFVICGEKEYKHCFDDIENLEYISTDSSLIKTYTRIRKLPMRILNKLTRTMRFREFEYWNKVARECEKNVLISGSFFIELAEKFQENKYLKAEKNYFKLGPYVMGCNFGPYRTNEYKAFFDKTFESAKSITFRDEYSYNLFKKENMSYAPDILFGFESDKIVKPDIDNYIVISLLQLYKDAPVKTYTDEKRKAVGKIQNIYEDKIIELSSKLIESGKNVVLLGFCNYQLDYVINQHIMDGIKKLGGDVSKIKVVNYPLVSAYEAVGYLKYSDYIVTTRYHGMILGGLFNKKVFAISYSDKIDNVIKDYMPNVKSIKCEDIEKLDVDLLKEDILENSGDVESYEDIVKKSSRHFEKLRQDLGY